MVPALESFHLAKYADDPIPRKDFRKQHKDVVQRIRELAGGCRMESGSPEPARTMSLERRIIMLCHPRYVIVDASRERALPPARRFH